jgi:hypothetical protein
VPVQSLCGSAVYYDDETLTPRFTRRIWQEGNMTAFRVVITPEDDSARGRGQAVIRVDTSPTPRILEIIITVSSADGLSGPSLLGIDLDGVIQALAAGAHPASDAVAPVPAPPPARAKSAATPTRVAAPVGRTARQGDRPYRQMPDPAELQAIFDKVGTVTGVAAHYQVPRHTAQGWMSRLRKSSGTTRS